MAPEPKGTRTPAFDARGAGSVLAKRRGQASQGRTWHDLFGGIAPFWPGLVSEPLVLGAKTVIGCAFVHLPPSNRDRKALVHPERP